VSLLLLEALNLLAKGDLKGKSLSQEKQNSKKKFLEKGGKNGFNKIKIILRGWQFAPTLVVIIHLSRHT